MGIHTHTGSERVARWRQSLIEEVIFPVQLEVHLKSVTVHKPLGLALLAIHSVGQVQAQPAGRGRKMQCK